MDSTQTDSKTSYLILWNKIFEHSFINVLCVLSLIEIRVCRIQFIEFYTKI